MALTAFCDGAVFGERYGTNPPRVLALHGWRKSHTDLVNVVRPFDAIALDLPGFGASPLPNAVWGAAEFADGIAPVFQAFSQPAVVLGHSFGGRVALQLAARHPQHVAALILTGVPLIRKPTTTRSVPLGYRLARWANRVGVLSDGYMEKQRRKRGSADYRAATGLQRDMFVKLVNESYEADIPRVQCHTQMVWGDNDTEAPLRNATDALPLFRDASLEVIVGGTHWSLVAEGTELQHAVRSALEGKV